MFYSEISAKISIKMQVIIPKSFKLSAPANLSISSYHKELYNLKLDIQIKTIKKFFWKEQNWTFQITTPRQESTHIQIFKIHFLNQVLIRSSNINFSIKKKFDFWKLLSFQSASAKKDQVSILKMNQVFSIVVIVALAQCVFSAPQGQQQQTSPVPIINQDLQDDGLGNFRYNFETGDGVKQEVSGTLKDIQVPVVAADGSVTGTEIAKGEVQTGSFSYPSPDGTIITLKWVNLNIKSGQEFSFNCGTITGGSLMKTVSSLREITCQSPNALSLPIFIFLFVKTLEIFDCLWKWRRLILEKS